VLDAPAQRSVLAVEGGVGQGVDDDVRVHAVAFDEPGAFGAIDTRFGGGGDAVVDQPVVHAEPDLATPGAGADHLAQAKPAEAFRERFAIRGGALVAQDDDVAAKGPLHVPGGATDAPLPVEPGAPEELLEDPAVDVAAAVM